MLFRSHNCAEEEGRCHPMSHLAAVSRPGNDNDDQNSPHIAFDHEVHGPEDQSSTHGSNGQVRASGQTVAHVANTYEIHPNGFRTANRPTASTSPLHSHNHGQQGDDQGLYLHEADNHRHPRDALDSEVSACSSQSDAGSGVDYSCSGTDGEGGDTARAKGGHRHRHHRRRRASLVAADPGDVLSFPRLAKVATIGGSVGPSPVQRYRTSTNTATTGTTRPSKSSSAGRATLSAADRSNSMRPSLKERFRIPGMRGIRGIRRRDSVLDIDRYQRMFEFPRCAYLLHRVVRLLWIPSEVRLPPIPNPR